MAIQKTEAIVLNRYDFRETSLIVNFYTRGFGKVSGLLKGIRKEPGKFASTMEPFSYNDIIFYKSSRSSLHLVSQCDIKDNFDGIRSNILKTAVSSGMLELLYIVCPAEDVNEDIFNLSLVCFKELEKSRDAEKLMMIFKIKILALSGFKPHFDSCVCCSSKIIGESKFSVALGGLLCMPCGSKDVKARLIFKGTIATILYIEKNDFKSNLNLGMNPLIKKELDFVLNSFLNFHLGRKLKSVEVIKSLR